MGDTLTFIGTATTVLRIGGFTLLTDPNFLHRGQRAYLGRGLWSRRLTEPALQPAQLPALDAVVLSHLHGDHFDRVARRGLRRHHRGVPVVTTEHAAQRLGQAGFEARALRTWERHELTLGGTGAEHPSGAGAERLSIEALPAVHARGVMGRLLPPVMGSLLEHSVGGVVRRRVYVSGDTLTGAHLDAVHERHPDVDAAVVHLGGTRVLLHTVTMDDVQGVDLLRRIAPRTAVPVHHDDYGVFRSPLSNFVERAGREGYGHLLRVPVRGQTVSLDPEDAGGPQSGGGPSRR